MNAGDSVATQIGQGLEFDGANDMIRIPDSASLERTEEVNRNEAPTQLASRITDLRLETRRLTAFEQAARQQLEQLAEAAKLARELTRHQQQRSQFERRLDLKVNRFEQLLTELEDAKLLLQQVQSRKGAGKSQPDRP